jgi:hypothetical protein
MSARKVLRLASASLTGLLFMACVWSSALAALSQHIVVCDSDSVAVPAHSLKIIHCETPSIPVGHFRIEYLAADTSVNGGIIQSVEANINFLDNSSNVWDFIDVAFTPYVNFPPGGFATFGATTSPNIDLQKSTIQNDPNGGANITKIQLQLQVFVQNNTAAVVVGSESLRAIVDY